MTLTGISGKVAVVTGANSGIGAVIARKLGSCGAKVAIHFHPASEHANGILHAIPQPSETEQLIQDLRKDGVDVLPVGADLLDPNSPREIFEAVEARLGMVDLLINNAAHCEAPDTLRETNADAVDRHFAVNVRAAALLAQELATRRHRCENRAGCVVNISTDSARAFPGQIIYGASKFALESLTRSLAFELGPAGIRVNAIAPGPVQTGWITKDLEDQVMPAIPLRRLGTPDDIAHAVVFLCSDQASWITGQVLKVSGGHVM